MNKTDLVYIGTAIIDVIIKGFDPEPVSATGYRAQSASLNIGGEAVNGAIAAAKLGARTAILCHLGNDAAGSMIEDELIRQGVDVSRIVHSDEHATPVTTMFVADDGSRKSITNRAHRYSFHPERYIEALDGAKAVVLGSLFRAPFDDPEVIRAVAEAAHRGGALVFADTKLPNFAKIGLDDIRDSLPFIDFITPNEDEGRFCTGEDEPEKMVDVFLAKGARNVVIKLGARGCYFRNPEEEIRLPACGIEAVDATGAGDNFLAGLASEMLRGDKAADEMLRDGRIRDALTFANACGAVCSTAVGAGTALKSRRQVLELIGMQS